MFLRGQLPREPTVESLRAVARNDVEKAEFERTISESAWEKLSDSTQQTIKNGDTVWVLGVCLWSALDMGILGLIREREVRHKTVVFDLDDYPGGEQLLRRLPGIPRPPMQSPFLAMFRDGEFESMYEGSAVFDEILTSFQD